jgi:hypothetical protein
MGVDAVSDSSIPLQVLASQRLSLAQIARILAARLYFRLGWSGCLGLITVLASAGIWLWLHHVQQQDRIAQPEPFISLSTTEHVEQPRIVPPDLPHAADSMQVLMRIKAAVQTSGLNWPQADYRIVPLSDEGLSTLEIHTTLKGPYPKLRQLIITLLDKEPALAMRGLTLVRQNGNVVDVEAKIQWVIFLADGWPPAEHQGKR